MEEINIWELDDIVSVKIKLELFLLIKNKLFLKYKTKRNAYTILKNKINISFNTFKNILKENYCNKNFFVPLRIWISLCNLLEISIYILQENITSYKISNGVNYISNPILPIKITPVFDMIIAHNIGDGTVIDSKKERLPYFGYRQFDPLFKELYIIKLESIFGKINFPEKYYLKSTRPYCPPVLASLFFKLYHLGTRDFLSKTARLPEAILKKDKEYLLAVLIAFIIDEGSIDSTDIVIGLKNIKLTEDLANICKTLGYEFTFTTNDKEYGFLYILRSGMKKFFNDYKIIVQKYPEMTLGKWDTKIDNTFKIYDRPIFKIEGNSDLILEMLIKEDLIVNEIARKINMTRQGVRFHIHNLEKRNLICKKSIVARSILYSYGGGRC